MERAALFIVERRLLDQGNLSLASLPGVQVLTRGTSFEPARLLIGMDDEHTDLSVMLVSEYGHALIPRELVLSCEELERLHHQQAALDIQAALQVSRHNEFLARLGSKVPYQKHRQSGFQPQF